MAINVYTDGSCYPNPNGFGGWAFVAVPDEGEEVIGSGSEEDTTNNRHGDAGGCPRRWNGWMQEAMS